MPYHRDGNCVYVEGKDKPLKCFKTVNEAKDYLTALNINVMGKGHKKSKSGLDEVQGRFDTVRITKG